MVFRDMLEDVGVLYSVPLEYIQYLVSKLEYARVEQGGAQGAQAPPLASKSIV